MNCDEMEYLENLEYDGLGIYRFLLREYLKDALKHGGYSL